MPVYMLVDASRRYLGRITHLPLRVKGRGSLPPGPQSSVPVPQPYFLPLFTLLPRRGVPAFSARLCEETDLDRLGEDLCAPITTLNPSRNVATPRSPP
jgi:hypothetical protein